MRKDAGVNDVPNPCSARCAGRSKIRPRSGGNLGPWSGRWLTPWRTKIARPESLAAHLIIPGSACEAPDPGRPGGLILLCPLHVSRAPKRVAFCGAPGRPCGRPCRANADRYPGSVEQGTGAHTGHGAPMLSDLHSATSSACSVPRFCPPRERLPTPRHDLRQAGALRTILRAVRHLGIHPIVRVRGGRSARSTG